MKRHFLLRTIVLALAACAYAAAQGQQPPQQQQSQPPVVVPGPPALPTIRSSTPVVDTPPPTQAQPTQQQNQQAPAGQQAAGQTGRRLSATDAFSMDNVSLVEMIDILATRLKINYILDKRVGGSVTVHVHGSMPEADLMPMLQTILRVNGAAIVQVGNLYHIVPINTISNLPMSPVTNADPKTLPDDERMILDLIFLKYTTADEMSKLVEPFLGEGATHSVYAPANLLIIQDNSRSMKRTLDLIDMFDSDTFVGQRVRVYELTNSRPSDMVKSLDTVFKAYSYSDKNSAVHFIGIDPINTLIAVAPNPDVFGRVKEWIDKFDIPAKPAVGGNQMWTYRMKYGRAEVVAMAILALYTGNPAALMSLTASMSNNMMQAGMGMNGFGGMGGYGGGGYGGYGGYGGGGYGGGYNSGYGSAFGAQPQSTGIAASVPVGQTLQGGGGAGQTGQYLNPAGFGQLPPNVPHIIPNPLDNTILVMGTPQDIEQIKSVLAELDVPPRQVLIEAKIYEVDLTGDFSLGVESYLQRLNSTAATGVTGNTGTPPSGLNTISGLDPSRTLTAAGGPGGIALTIGALVSKNNQLIGLLNAAEQRGKSRVISAPSIIATDSIPATMNVGTQVPALSSQALVPGAQAGGSSLFANTVNNVATGVSLNIVAHVNSSGIVTMQIDQQVSAPIAPTASSAIASPSFSNRSMATQVTVHDGDMVAIGGAILESHTDSTGGIPVLSRIPGLGPLFGAKSTSTSRTELIIFLTPRVIYDTNQITEATEEIKQQLKRVAKLMKDQ
jgi:general secretion pathway protein D